LLVAVIVALVGWTRQELFGSTPQAWSVLQI